MATKLGTLTLDLVARIGSFTQGMRQASATAEREMGRVQNSVVTVDGLIKKLAVTAGAVFSVGQITNYADSYTGMVNKLKLVTTSQGELSQAMADTHKIAQATASDWNGVLDVYTKFQGLSKKLGIDQAEVARITETVTKTVAMSGQSATASEAALLQFGQALNTGLLRGTELTSVMSQAPALAKAIADGMGAAVGDLKKLGEEGKITSEVMRDALLKMSSSVDAEYAKTATTVSASFNLIKNEAIKVVGEFDGATGASKTFVEGVTLLSENMSVVTTTMGVGAAFMAGTYIPAIYGTIAAGLVKTKQMTDQTIIQYGLINAERAAAASALAQAQAQIINTQSTLTAIAAEKALEVQRLQAQINAAGRMATTTRMAQLRRIEAQATAELTVAETALAAARVRSAAATTASAGVGRAALGVLFGPVGMGVALASVAAGYLLMKDGTDESTKSLRENNESVEDAIKKYNELDEVKRRAQLVSEKDRLQDLGKEYDDITAKLITATYSFSRHNDMTSEQSQQVNALIAEYKKSGDIDEFSAKINSLSFINQTSKDRFNTLGGAVKSAGDEFKNQKSTVEQMAPALKGTADQAKQSAVEVSGLSEELKKLFDQANQNLKNSQVTIALADRGYNDEMISLAQKYLAIEGAIVKNEQGKKVLRNDLKKLLKAEYDAIMGAKNAVDGRNKSEEKTKKLIEAQGAAMKVNALVAANAAKYNFAAIESKNKLPAGLLSAIHMQESKGDPSAYNKSSGATGGFQFLKGTADQYGVKNRNDLVQSAEGAGKYMAYLLKLFKGDLDKAVSAYHAGEGNVQRGTNIGPVNREYVKNIKGYMGGASGVSFTEDYSFDEWVKEQEKIAVERANQAQKQKEIQVRYYNDWQNLEADNQEKIKDIQESFANDPAERDRLIELQAKAYEVDVGNWFKAQDEKVAAEREANKQILAERYNLINASLAMSDQIKNLSSGAEDINARASMSPQAYAEWSLSNNRSNAQLDLKKDRVGVEQDIMTSDLYSNDDDRYGALVEAHQAYRDGLAAIDVDYYQKRDDLQNQTQAASLAGYGVMFGMMGSMLDAYGDKESTSYKVAFAMQKGFVLTSAIMNAKGAIMSAWNDPANVTIWQKMAGAAAVAVQTNDLMSAIQGTALAGMAHDGIDNIPKEGTWLLDKGERVVDSRTNGDLKDYLAKGGGSGGNVTINQSINIASDGTATTQNDSKQLGALINNAVLAVIRKEQRQGGLLSR